tara:strand:- start:1556 stop:2716 length:1161 start_codon:yes stop_codon:yes gene_type:complete
MNKIINPNRSFTVHDRRDVDSRINSDLNIIADILLPHFSNIESLVLAGSFGRGEGSVLIHNNNIQPINDYDIYVITKDSSFDTDIESIRNIILDRIQIRQVDIEVIQFKKLKYLRPTMANYDLKYASYIFYGNNNVLDAMPSINKYKLGLKEGRTPLLLYLISVIQSYPFKKDKEISKNEKFWMYQQICKSILGWSSALLILKGKYHSSYIEREKIFKSTFDNKIWCQLVEKATKFKLSPYLIIEEDITALWNLNKDVHMNVLKLFLSKYYSKKYSKNNFRKNWLDIVQDYRNDYENILRKVYGFIFKKSFYKDRINLTVIEILLLSAKQGDKIDKDLFISVNNEINKFNNSKKIEYSWNSAMKFCIDNDSNCKIWKEKGNSIFYN